MANENVKIGIALTLGIALGGGAGYFLAERKIRAQAEEEIQGVRDLYKRLRDEDAAQARADWSSAPEEDTPPADIDSITPESLAEEAVSLGYINEEDVQIKRDRNYLPPEYTEAGDEPFPTPNQVEDDLREDVEYVHNLRFINPPNGDENDVTKWDRSPMIPYVITESEFRIDRQEFEKLSITWYAGDETLADDQGRDVQDVEGTVGINNLQYFGLASGDDHVVHIRNERVMADFEVTLDEGSWARHVLGFNIEDKMLRDSKKQIKKMRPRE